jgi:hypothetical protein
MFDTGFIAWLLKVQNAVHQCAESIRRSEKRKKDKQLPPEKPIEVHAVVSFSDEEKRDTKADSGRAHNTQNSIKNAAWAAFVAASIYALIASLQWCEMKKTTKATQDQLALLRDADRPWIDLDILITSPLTYDGNAVQAEFTFVPTDVGRSPAQNISINPTLTPAFMGDDLREIQKRLCDSAATKSGMASLQYVLFPGRHYTQPVGMEISVKEMDSHWGKMPSGLGPIDPIPVALVGCVDYTYESSDHHHQTAFAVDVLMKDGKLPLKSKAPLAPGSLILRPHPTSGHYPN